MAACVRLFCVCVVLCVGSGLPTGWSAIKRVLPPLYGFRNLKKRPGSTRAVEPLTDTEGLSGKFNFYSCRYNIIAPTLYENPNRERIILRQTYMKYFSTEWTVINR
jgi:hypothetical protein